jgi:predicted nuclease with TOPRIM domain
MTTKQKKFLEKTFECLGISIEDFMEINNLKAYEERVKRLEDENKFLADVNTKQNEVIIDLRGQIEELNQKVIELIVGVDSEA